MRFEVQQIVLVPGALVSITAEDDTASENGTDPGIFRVSRSPANATPLTVNLRFAPGGTTTGGDFSLAGDSLAMSAPNARVTIPANEASVDVVLTPVDDNAPEGTETFGFVLRPGVGYSIDNANNQAVVSILDSDFVITNTNDAGAGSLRQAVTDAVSAGGGTVTFDKNVFASPQTIVLTSGEISITDSVTIGVPGGASSPHDYLE